MAPDEVIGGTTLAEALGRHGPLAAPSALVVAQQLCADASSMESARLRRCLGSLRTAHIVRTAEGSWRWQPAAGAALDRPPRDTDVAGRIGAVLFECLTVSAVGEDFLDGGRLRARLREHRPDLALAVIDVTVRLVTAPGSRRITLEGVALELQHALGAKVVRGDAHRLTPWVGVLALMVVGLVGGLWAMRTPGDDPEVGSHGLSAQETARIDLLTESADRWTMNREFIAAFLQLDDVTRIWQTRVDADDPRVAGVLLRHAWARRERGDLLTTEQVLTTGLGPLERALGATHPYVRAVRLNLADVLERRGATHLAVEQRFVAAAASRQLLPLPVATMLEASGGPPGPGVLAHLAPKAPELESFRLVANGAWFAPLTSTARWLAERNGWRLHVAATGACRASVDVGPEAQRLELDVRRADDGWRVIVNGVRPPVDVDISGPADRQAAISVWVTPDRDVRVIRPDGTTTHAELTSDAAANPPYGLTFVGARPDEGCSLVWWEVSPHP